MQGAEAPPRKVGSRCPDADCQAWRRSRGNPARGTTRQSLHGAEPQLPPSANLQNRRSGSCFRSLPSLSGEGDLDGAQRCAAEADGEKVAPGSKLRNALAAVVTIGVRWPAGVGVAVPARGQASGGGLRGFPPSPPYEPFGFRSRCSSGSEPGLSPPCTLSTPLLSSDAFSSPSE